MKVFLLSDYFYPFTPGGSEWSVYELAKSLQEKGITPVVVTINYGANSYDKYHGVEIIRIPFFKKLTATGSVVSPIWQNNPLFFAISAYYLFKIIRTGKPDIIHINGKFLIPGGIIASFLSKKPTIVTIRDKQIICPIGKCFFRRNRQKACNFWEYMTSDFIWFVANYTKWNPLNVMYAFFGALWAKIAGNIIGFFAKRSNVITAISKSQKEYLEANGFRGVKVIYNTADFKAPKKSSSGGRSILFVGKLSGGKGVDLLLDAVEKIIPYKNLKVLFVGSMQSAKIKSRLGEKPLKPYVENFGVQDHEDLAKIYRRASLVCMPSTYPESFGRAALEALAVGTPAVVTNMGALPEIVEDGITGRIADTTAKSLKGAILDVMENESGYRDNIKKNYNRLKLKFMDNPIKSYIKLYKQQTK